ncbi:MAG: hypothetical protein RI894_1107 [Bacteroidota bacterium]|jgi:hypothetical protein
MTKISQTVAAALITLASCTTASAQYSPFVGGVFLNKNGAELGYKAAFNPGVDELRAGGKLENVTFGVKYLTFNSLNKGLSGGGIGLDLGYDWRFARNFGLNANLTNNWLNYTPLASSTKTNLNIFQFAFNFYGHFEAPQKAFFIKPMIGFAIGFDTYKYTFPNSQNTTTTQTFSQRSFALADLGLGIGVPIKNFTIGLLPVYRAWSGAFLLTASVGYNFSLEEDFDGKGK